MYIITTEVMPGQNYEALSVVKGSTVQTVNVGKDFLSGLKTLVGGEIHGYSEMLEKARNVAVQRMVAEAESLGADAIIGVRFSSSSIMQSAAEILAYGTAVRFL